MVHETLNLFKCRRVSTKALNVSPSSGLQCDRTGRFNVTFSWNLLQQNESLQALGYVFLFLGSPGASLELSTLDLSSFWSWIRLGWWPSYNTQERRGKLVNIIKWGVYICTYPKYVHFTNVPVLAENA